MMALGRRMSRLLLALVLISQLAYIIECSTGRDPDDYDDLDDEDVEIVFDQEDSILPNPHDTDIPKPDEKLSSERYLKLIRPRLGHFERFPELRRLYEDYFEKSMKIRDATMNRINKAEDWRSMRPTPEFCVSFLTIFKSKAKKYTINKPIDIIPLDACLEWVFLNEVTVPEGHPDHERQERAVSERELDLRQSQSTYIRSKVEDLISDSTLESIYRDTLFGVPDRPEVVNGRKILKDPGVPRRMRLKLKKYLLRLLDINVQNPGKGCHSLWLDAYSSFMEQVYLDCDGKPDCQHFGEQRLDEDRYFRLVAESTIQAANACYKTMQSSILSLQHSGYDSKAKSVILTRNMFVSKNKLDRQYEQQKWSREMVKILQLVSGQPPDKQISLGEVARTLWEIKSGDEFESSRLLKTLGEYAIANVDKVSNEDPQGVKRYARAITRLCKPYIDEKLFLANAGAIDLDEEEIKNKEPFLFYHLIYSLIRLTNHESIYGISKDTFENDVLKNRWEALYLTTLACQMISTTTGEISQDTNEAAFEVNYQYDSVRYIDDWPLEVMYQRLVKVAGKPDGSLNIEPERKKLNFRSKLNKPQPDESPDDNQEEAVPASWSDDESDNEDEADKQKSKPIKKKEKVGPKRHTGKSIADYGDALSSRLKKTLGRFRLGGSSSGSRSAKRGNNGFLMSEEMIRKYHEQYGRWPDLPDNIRQIYPKLPADCVKKQETPVVPKVVPKVVPVVSPVKPAPKIQVDQGPTETNRPTDGYWVTRLSKEDGLPVWENDDVVLPPRRSRQDMF